MEKHRRFLQHGIITSLLTCSLFITGGQAIAATQVDLWHAFTGRLGTPARRAGEDLQ